MKRKDWYAVAALVGAVLLSFALLIAAPKDRVLVVRVYPSFDDRVSLMQIGEQEAMTMQEVMQRAEAGEPVAVLGVHQ